MENVRQNVYRVKKVLWFIAFVVMTIVVGLPFAFCYHGGCNRQFNPSVWKQSRHGRENLRGAMVRDLLRSHDLRGLRKDQIISLLGEPDYVNYVGEDDFSYSLGLEHGWFPNDEILILKFHSGVVSEIRVATVS
jgi:hypothetical protein